MRWSRHGQRTRPADRPARRAGALRHGYGSIRRRAPARAPGPAGVRPGTFQLTLDEVAVAEMLIAGGLLSPNDADDHRKLSCALEQQIEILIELSRYA